MPAPVPIIEQIALAYVAALSQIATTNAMPGTSDHWPITVKVDRRIPNGNVIDDQLVVLVQGDAEMDEEQMYGENGLIYWRQNWTARCYVVERETAEPSEQFPIDTRINEIASCVEKALMADPQLIAASGLTVDTYLRSRTLYAPEATTGVDVNFECKYRVSLTDPYTLG